MRHKTGPRGTASENAIKDIRRATRKQYSAEEKIRIVLDGLRGEETIVALNTSKPGMINRVPEFGAANLPHNPMARITRTTGIIQRATGWSITWCPQNAIAVNKASSSENARA